MAKPMQQGKVGFPDTNLKSRFRSMLLDISKDIGHDDMDKLLYLCRDFGVGANKLETMKLGIELFMELENRRLITPHDISLLTSLLETIQRRDLINKLEGWSTKEKAHSNKITDYRKLILKVSENLPESDFSELRYLLSESLPVSEMEKCKSFLQLFVKMEKSGKIGPTNLDMLVDLMNQVGNQAIAKEIENYQETERMQRPQMYQPEDQEDSRDSRQTEPCASVSVGVTERMQRLQISQPKDQEISRDNQEQRRQIESVSANDIEPDAAGLYLGREMRAAKPTEEQKNSSRNYSSLFESRHKGIAFILNIDSSDRKGSEVDVRNIQHVFTQLGYDVQICQDLTNDEFRQSLLQLVQTINKGGPDKHSSVVLFLMAHGSQRGIKCADNKYVSMNDIKKYFFAKECSALNNKPKIFFAQACRGRNMPQAAPDEELQTDSTQLDVDAVGPDNADIYVAYATSDGCFSMRNKVEGSWFVQAICEEFLARAHIDDLDTMMESVSQRVTEIEGYVKIGDDTIKALQTPDIQKQGIRRKIFFAPKYPPAASS